MMKTSILSLYLILFFTSCSFYNLYGQQIDVFGPTGSAQTYTVPPCTESISVVLSGAGGGGPNGGLGAVLDLTVPVQPGDEVTIIVGETATGVAGGYPNGGNGQTANNTGNASFGGGGSSMIYVNGVLVAVAGGGGGTGGGTQDSGGASGGCNTGSGTAGAPFGVGGGNASQTAGGAGGPPWISSGNSGQPGSSMQGGNGATDPCYNNSPGGGGGGGYFGGGGGGSDCFGSSPYGGGAGGGGSSYNPSGDPCTPAQNAGNGQAVVTANAGVAASNSGPYCVGSTIQLNATAGATSYEWTGPNGFTSNLQNPTISNATIANAGTYTLIGVGTGCDEPSTTQVVVVAPPTPNAGPDTVICLGQPIPLNGTITAGSTIAWTANTTGITPTPTVTFQPNASSVSPTVTVNQPGVYTFTLSENNGVCPAVTDQVQVTVSRTTHTTSWTGPSCAGMTDGTITVTNPDAVEYSYDGGTTWVTNATQGGYGVGTYTVFSRNQYGCSFSSSVTITEPDQLYVFASEDTLICQNGSADLVAYTSAPGMTTLYHWSHTNSTDSAVTTVPLTNNLTIEVYAEGPGGCLSDTAEIIVSVRPPLSGTISPYDTICPGYPTTIGVSYISGGLAPYNILWDTGDITSGASSMEITVNPPQTHMYTVTITDVCETTPLVLSTQVYVAPLPVPLMSAVEPELCEPAVFEIHYETDAAMTQSYVWYYPTGESAINEPVIYTDTLMEGKYNVQLIVTSPLGCIDSVTMIDFLTVQAKPVADFSWSPNPVLMFNTEVHFQNLSHLDVEYDWSLPGAVPSYSNLERPKVTYPDGETGTYPVTLIVTSEMGCTDTITKNLIVYPEVTLYAPNTFTPDGDEYNQNWKVYIQGVDVYAFNLQVFNRWGEMVFENHDSNEGWDGMYNGKPVPTGMYTWKISARDIHNDGKYEWNGYVTILR